MNNKRNNMNNKRNNLNNKRNNMNNKRNNMNNNRTINEQCCFLYHYIKYVVLVVLLLFDVVVS